MQAAAKVLIGTPVYDRQVLAPYHEAVFGLLNAFRRSEVEFDSWLFEGTQIAASRNIIATKVLLDERYSHLLFIDADMGFGPGLIRKMLDFDQPVVGCVYPQRHHDYDAFARITRSVEDPRAARLIAQRYAGGDADLHGADTGRLTVRGSFVRAVRAGAAILLIKREVLMRLRERFPELWGESTSVAHRALEIGDGLFQPFAQTLQSPTGMVYGEDYAFSHRWVEGCGGEIWSCFDETITHTGRERFVGNYSVRMRPKPQQDAQGRDS